MCVVVICYHRSQTAAWLSGAVTSSYHDVAPCNSYRRRLIYEVLEHKYVYVCTHCNLKLTSCCAMFVYCVRVISELLTPPVDSAITISQIKEQ